MTETPVSRAAELAALDLLICFNVRRWQRDIEKSPDLPETPNHLDLASIIASRFAKFFPEVRQ